MSLTLVFDDRDFTVSDNPESSGVSKSVGFGLDSGEDSSVTRSGVNTGNITITDVAGQQALTGQSIEESKAGILTTISTETAKANSGAIANNFDKDKVQSEIDVQVAVTQAFDANRQEVGITAENIVNAVKATSEIIGEVINAAALAKQYEQISQSMTVEEKTALDNLFKELDSSTQIETNWAPALAEGVALAGSTCARIPACASAVINLFGAAAAEVILNSGEKKEEATPQPLPSTSGNSATGMPPNGEDEDKKNIEKTSHAQLRADQGRPVGQAINDIQKARNSDILIQSRDGSYVVRGINGREHIVSQDGKLITSISSRSSQANRNLLQSGQRRPASQAEIDKIKSFVK